MKIPRRILKKVMTVLIHAVGDTRQCPHCRKEFVPEDTAQKDCWEMYQLLEKEVDYAEKIKKLDKV